VAEVWVKDESWRLGLPAFKMLGASYASYRALTSRLGHQVRWDSVDELAGRLAALGSPDRRLSGAGNGPVASHHRGHNLGAAAAKRSGVHTAIIDVPRQNPHI